MSETKLPGHKVFLFSLIVFISFFLLAELSARIILVIRNSSYDYILYGFKDLTKFQDIKARDGYAAYYKGKPSNNKKNPVNRMGFRGPEIKPNKNGTIRIVCLGSSTTYGDDLDYADTYPVLLQNKLNTRYGTNNFEVINAGQSGFVLSHIMAMLKYDITPLQPDFILVSNINNNLKAPGFWFLDLQGRPESSRPPVKSQTIILTKIKTIIVNRCALGFLLNELILAGTRNYIYNFDWKSFGQALMVSDNIWEEDYINNMQRLIQISFENNPQAKIILIGEAVNSISFPEMGPPFAKAHTILSNLSKKHPDIYFLNVQDSLISAAQQGIEVWQDLTHTHDPLHLSRAGNEIMANTIADFIAQLSKTTFDKHL